MNTCRLFAIDLAFSAIWGQQNFSVSDIFYLNSKLMPPLIEKIRDCGASMNMLLKNLFNLNNATNSQKLTYGKHFLACKPITFMWTLALKNLCLWRGFFWLFYYYLINFGILIIGKLPHYFLNILNDNHEILFNQTKIDYR